MGDVRLRLAGIDAPELQQTCLARGARIRCGEAAQHALSTLVVGHLVVCASPDGSPRTPLAESFGRPVVTCRVWRERGEAAIDLAGWMVREGLAAPLAEEANPEHSDYRPLSARGGACTLAPRLWRNDAAAKRAFETLGIVPSGGSIGDCPLTEEAGADAAPDAS
jgi:endonuclease YncB( thermonuclease family)